MPIQNTSLVLSCESHPKCKLKATNNYIKRTLRKVNNPCTHKYMHHCYPPVGNSTSPSLMFLSLKLDIRGLNPQSSITLPLGVAINHLAKVINGNGEHARITQELKYKRRRTKYITHHNLNIVSYPSDPSKVNIATTKELHRCVDHVGRLTRTKK